MDQRDFHTMIEERTRHLAEGLDDTRECVSALRSELNGNGGIRERVASIEATVKSWSLWIKLLPLATAIAAAFGTGATQGMLT